MGIISQQAIWNFTKQFKIRLIINISIAYRPFHINGPVLVVKALIKLFGAYV